MALVPNYVPTDWVDHVTPVDEAHMDKLDLAVDQHADAINALDVRVAAEEAQPDVPAVVNGKWIKGVGGAMVYSDITIADVGGLQTALNGKENQSAKGAASGYAPLDASSKVPAANLPAGIDLRYAGTYSAATAYKEGDVVIYNGVSYMALRATTAETPTPWGTGGAGGGVGSWDTVAMLTTQFDTTSQSAVDITGLTAALLANTMYEFDVLLELQSTSSAGVRTGLQFSTAGAVHEAYWSGMQTVSAPNQATTNVFGTTVNQVWAGNASTPAVARAYGVVRVGANAGNLTVQMFKVTSGTGSALTGSQLKVRKLV
jgi:hypothetical protein